MHHPDFHPIASAGRFLPLACRGAVALGTVLLWLSWVACSPPRPPNLTGQEVDAFKAQNGRLVEIEGRLEQGRQGLMLVDGPASSVNFFVFAAPIKGATGELPEAWEKRLHKRVRLSGKLRFQSFEAPPGAPVRVVSPDFYYMILQQTRIEDASQP